MHGLDWCGLVLGALGAWPAGSKTIFWRRWGFIVWVLSDCFWLGFGIEIHSIPLILTNILFIITSTRGALNANKAL